MPRTAASRDALAEIALIRATAAMEHIFADIAYKLVCGAHFSDGQPDIVIVPSRSLIGARKAMLGQGDPNISIRQNLKWTRAKFIKESVQGVLDDNSRFLKVCQKHGSVIAEIFDVRNHAAHRNYSSKNKFMVWVRRTYGQDRSIPVGRFLLTKNVTIVPKIDQYFVSMRVIINDLVDGK